VKLNNRPKLFPPLALLAPIPAPAHGGSPDRSPLSRMELRRIVAELID
jgi:hypothetical protein